MRSTFAKSGFNRMDNFLGKSNQIKTTILLTVLEKIHSHFCLPIPPGTIPQSFDREFRNICIFNIYNICMWRLSVVLVAARWWLCNLLLPIFCLICSRHLQGCCVRLNMMSWTYDAREDCTAAKWQQSKTKHIFTMKIFNRIYAFKW